GKCSVAYQRSNAGRSAASASSARTISKAVPIPALLRPRPDDTRQCIRALLRCVKRLRLDPNRLREFRLSSSTGEGPAQIKKKGGQFARPPGSTQLGRFGRPPALTSFRMPRCSPCTWRHRVGPTILYGLSVVLG